MPTVCNHRISYPLEFVQLALTAKLYTTFIAQCSSCPNWFIISAENTGAHTKAVSPDKDLIKHVFEELPYAASPFVSPLTQKSFTVKVTDDLAKLRSHFTEPGKIEIFSKEE